MAGCVSVVNPVTIRTIGQLNIVNLNNKLDIWARAQELTRLEGSRIGASPLTLSALSHMSPWWVVKLNIRNRQRAVTCSRG